MLYALLLMVVVSGIAALMFLRTIAEIRHSGDDAAIVQTLLLARGAANAGGASLQQTVRQELHAIVEADSSTTGRWAFGLSGANDPAPSPSSVLNQLTLGVNSVAGKLQGRVDALLCDLSITPSSGGVGGVRVYVTSTACGEGLPDGVLLPGGRFVSGAPRTGAGSIAPQVYAIPFVMVAEGTLGNYRRNVVLQGEYRFEVGRSSFAKYALFTNNHTTGGNNPADVWFTRDTMFDGPVHTNQYFRFYNDPWFGGTLSSTGCVTAGNTGCTNSQRIGAQFYSETYRSIAQVEVNPSSGVHAPILADGAEWGSEFVPLPGSNFAQREAAMSSGLLLDTFGDRNSTSSNNNYSIERLHMWAADVNGNALTPVAGGGYTPAAVYQYIQVCTGTNDSTCIRYRYGADNALYRETSFESDDWTLQQPDFNGVLFVDGDVRRFEGPDRVPSNSSNPDDAPPALASFAQVTLAANRDVRITGDLKYEDDPCTGSAVRNDDGTVTRAQCNNVNAVNVLGVYTQTGDISIGNENSTNAYNAPRNVTIDGVLMTSRGVVQVENWSIGNDPRGTARILGGVIEYNYGAFGMFNSSSGQMVRGYSRSFTFDRRMGLGLSPPHFPTIENDGVRNVSVFSFGQREQIY